MSDPIEITSINNDFPRINNGVRFMAGYYSDYDHLQHVVAASKDGYVYKVHWGPNHLPSPQRLGEHEGFRFVNMATIAGFFTPDDKYHHAVVGTSDGNLHEFYYRLDGSLHITEAHKTDLPPSYISGFQDGCGMAGFYSPNDNLRHVVIVDSMGKLEDITWTRAPSPVRHIITIPLSVNQIASISGFLSHDANPNTRHIIVAEIDHGQIYDIDYPQSGPPSTVDQYYLKTIFGFQVQNVTAFFNSDTNYRHIVVLTTELGQNSLKLRAYDTYGGLLISGSLTSLPGDVADITSFFNADDADDHKCHVLYATHGGYLTEITYTIQ